jgi:hypothetical protein
MRPDKTKTSAGETEHRAGIAERRFRQIEVGPDKNE